MPIDVGGIYHKEVERAAIVYNLKFNYTYYLCILTPNFGIYKILQNIVCPLKHKLY